MEHNCGKQCFLRWVISREKIWETFLNNKHDQWPVADHKQMASKRSLDGDARPSSGQQLAVSLVRSSVTGIGSDMQQAWYSIWGFFVQSLLSTNLWSTNQMIDRLFLDFWVDQSVKHVEMIAHWVNSCWTNQVFAAFSFRMNYAGRWHFHMGTPQIHQHWRSVLHHFGDQVAEWDHSKNRCVASMNSLSYLINQTYSFVCLQMLDTLTG